MKTLYTIIALFIGSTFYGQTFKSTTDYKISDLKSVLNTTKVDYNQQFEVYLTKDDEPLIKLIDLSKNDLDLFLDTTIEILENPNLKNVKAILKIKFEFLACCIETQTQYFAVTNENLLTELPILNFTQCEVSTSNLEYIFPNQEFGQDNVILEVIVNYNKKDKTKSIEILNKIVWEERDVIEEYSYNYEN